ncbi:IS3 family transposase [Conexibacter sp. DBS9H8]|uniref:IS3 family transposase n=1 Tax=Conexibacter sp. DBS9H8 TaxID=2937801 RepID=UPI0035310B72
MAGGGRTVDRAAKVPDPELVKVAKRRTFTAEYKARILAEADAATGRGQVGELLRREGLYSSLLTEWRKQRDAGALAGLSESRGRKAVDKRDREITALKRRAEHAEAELGKARKVIGGPGKSLRAVGRDARDRQREKYREMIANMVEELTPIIGTRPACRALGASAASIYRRRRPPAPRPSRPRPAPERALSAAERREVLDVLHSERFVDMSPEVCWATLLDEGRYLCSPSTMYRLLRAQHGTVRDRRNQLTHPPAARPELLAQAPNELWSWDISKLKGPAKWTYFYLYVILDVFSRYVVGWTVEYRENAAIAAALIDQAVDQQNIAPHVLTLHADRGSAMRSKPVAHLLADLGVTKTHSRPYTSSDNPYSEAGFKTLKYRPGFPARFDSIEHARRHCRDFVAHYNHEHRHSGIGLMTPAAVHHGTAAELHHLRGDVLDAAYATHPERFVNAAPTPPALPAAAWINKPPEPEKAAQ